VLHVTVVDAHGIAKPGYKNQIEIPVHGALCISGLQLWGRKLNVMLQMNTITTCHQISHATHLRALILQGYIRHAGYSTGKKIKDIILYVNRPLKFPRLSTKLPLVEWN